MAPTVDQTDPVIGRIGRTSTGRGDTLPSIDDLAARIRFCPKAGRIWLDDSRMILLHVHALGALRNELIETVGMQGARALLTRMGYASGAQDAELAIKVRGGGACDFFDFFTVGPQLHMLEGIVTVEPLRIERDVKTGHFYGELLWHDSSEDEVHIASHGIGTESACWMQIGYASGYTSVIMGRPVLFREVECRATGHSACRIIGKPVADWSDADDDIRYLQPHAFANKADQRRIVVGLTPDRTPEAPPPAGPLSATRQLVGASAGFNVVCHMIEKVAGTSATVLLLGESGVGKEMFAQTLHAISGRADRPFVAVNCAAIPENLLESELFGVEKGAYTGAVASRPGRFERADGGTLFLDEIGTLSLSAQGKLLRALQEGEIERVGDVKARRVDVRLVAATNVDLRDSVARGRFREDLFYRLNVFPVVIPPLRDRRADIPVLLNHFLQLFAARHGKPVAGFTQRAITGLYAYGWPGNVRELENMVERGVILVPADGQIDLCHLFTSGERVDPYVMEMGADGRLSDMSPDSRQGRVTDVVDQVLQSRTPLDELEECLLRAAVERAGGNLSEAARALGLTRAQLAYRMKKFGDGDLAAGLQG
ncbi:sigma 54-interacting transcriptional regulator [Zavarzinia compransoris]|uniref:sigma-54-dependent Fis family transcriptional regulator n=1 Tax=Zavarzinia marina TaxID=2911065 RepID=UPI001F379C25|nr:sigma-54-dependent Fis family transcriptional regulator [Zavarzinia marina]MCF4165754.1 sigma 54-interacting transcriptional regulator [Zavarzinia marina]